MVRVPPAPTPANQADLRAAVVAGLEEGIELRSRLASDGADAIAAVAVLLVERLAAGNTVMLCGNGGSAADAQHIAAELSGRFARPTRRALSAIALTTDSSAITAIANDLGYEQVFARQVEALARPGDVLVAISTSGRSGNVLQAAETASRLGLSVVALTGPDASPLGDRADLTVAVPGSSPARVQELHITVGHLLCAAIDDALDR